MFWSVPSCLILCSSAHNEVKDLFIKAVRMSKDVDADVQVCLFARNLLISLVCDFCCRLALGCCSICLQNMTKPLTASVLHCKSGQRYSPCSIYWLTKNFCSLEGFAVVEQAWCYSGKWRTEWGGCGCLSQCLGNHSWLCTHKVQLGHRMHQFGCIQVSLIFHTPPPLIIFCCI
jgi:hypothetical protein